jgi:hypothetical protein
MRGETSGIEGSRDNQSDLLVIHGSDFTSSPATERREKYFVATIYIAINHPVLQRALMEPMCIQVSSIKDRHDGRRQCEVVAKESRRGKRNSRMRRKPGEALLWIKINVKGKIFFLSA